MKKTTMVLCVGLAFLLLSCGCATSQASNNCIEDSIFYVPYYHDPRGSLMIVDGVINDSTKCSFDTDTGVTDCDIMVDSAFFFRNFDLAKFKQEKSRFKMKFYREYFDGHCTVQVGNHKFDVKRILVQNFNVTERNGAIFQGRLGSSLFENKITIVDFEKRRLAFVDSIKADSTYAMVRFVPLRGDSLVGKLRYVEVAGFRGIRGQAIKTRFIFDTGCTFAVALKHEIGVNLSNTLSNQSTVMATGSWNLPLEQIQGVVDSLTIGPFAFKNPAISYCAQGGMMDPRSQISGADGLLGLAFLTRFHLIIDYKNNKLYLKPNAYFNSKFKYWWDAAKDSVYINNDKRAI